MPDLTQSKKQKYEADLASIKTKAGRDRYIAEFKQKLDPAGRRHSKSMGHLLNDMKRQVDENPEPFVQKRISMLEAKISQLSDSVDPVEKDAK